MMWNDTCDIQYIQYDLISLDKPLSGPNFLRLNGIAVYYCILLYITVLHLAFDSPHQVTSPGWCQIGMSDGRTDSTNTYSIVQIRHKKIDTFRSRIQFEDTV